MSKHERGPEHIDEPEELTAEEKEIYNNIQSRARKEMPERKKYSEAQEIKDWEAFVATLTAEEQAVVAKEEKINERFKQASEKAHASMKDAIKRGDLKVLGEDEEIEEP